MDSQQNIRLILLLEEIVEAMRFQSPDFAASCSDENADAPLPKSEEEVAAFIANRTRYFREKWILSKLAQAANDARRLLDGDSQELPINDDPPKSASLTTLIKIEGLSDQAAKRARHAHSLLPRARSIKRPAAPDPK